MKFNLLILSFIFLFCTPFKTQSEDEIIAKIGNISISKNEFILRYELTPQLNRGIKGIKQDLKKEFLYTLIAEKLFAMEALENHKDTKEAIGKTLTRYEQMFVRDELYRKEVKEKSKLYADSLLDNYLQNPASIDAGYIVSQNEAEAENIYSLLEKGIPFDSLYIELNNDDGKEINIHIGDFHEKTEEKIWQIKTGEYSEPVKINERWYILKIVKRNFPIQEKTENWESVYERLSKTAGERAENSYYKQFLRDFFKDKNIEVNPSILKSAAHKISNIFRYKKNSKNSKDENLFLEPKDLDELISRFDKDTLNMIYIKTDTKNIYLKEFLEDLKYESFYSKEADFNSVASLLNSRTKTFIEHRLLTEEGYIRGLQNSPGVKESFIMWRDNYLYQLAQLQFMDSAKVSDEETYEYFLKNEKKYIRSPEVNIVEVLTDSLEIAEKVLDAINNNEDIHKLAELYSKRDFTKETRGEFGFFPVSMYGEIGRIAGRMEIGEVYGPLVVPEGYSIFKVIGKKDESYKIPVSFDKNKEEIKREVAYKKTNSSIINYTVKLAEKYNIQINEDLLSSINVSSINSFAYRHLGFGGRITGVPLISPNVEWVKYWQENIKSVP